MTARTETPTGQVSARRSSARTSSPVRGEAGRGRRIRVAFVVNTMHVGGTELNALRTAERLDASRLDITVITLAREGPLLERYRHAGIRVVQVPITSLHNRSTLAAARRLYRLLRDERIDVLHCHDIYSNVFAVPVGRLARVPLVIASRRWTHPWGDRRVEVANRLVYRLAHRVLGNSAAVATMLREVDGVPARRVVELPNFVDDDAFASPGVDATAAFRAECGIPDDALVLGCVARVEPVKDHESLVRAFAALAPAWPALHLCVVGDGSRRPALEQLAIELGVGERVHFAGQRPASPNLHHAFDISALTSLSEGFPNSLVEAMAAGRPVVATNVGGNPDAVRTGTGLLVPPGEPAQLAAAFERLLGDKKMRHSMGVRAQKVARDEFHADSVLGRLESLYAELLAQRTGGRRG